MLPSNVYTLVNCLNKNPYHLNNDFIKIIINILSLINCLILYSYFVLKKTCITELAVPSYLGHEKTVNLTSVSSMTKHIANDMLTYFAFTV